MALSFTKMHGLGNDFVVVDGVTQKVSLSARQIRALADRHMGIGYDQLLLVEPPSQPDVDFNYRIFNVDGSEVEHCGNGARCFALFVKAKGLSLKNPLTVKTLNRVISLRFEKSGDIAVDMGKPILDPALLPFHAESRAAIYHRTLRVNGADIKVEFGAVSMGNPHAVIIVEDLGNTAVKEIGQALQDHLDFPDGVNVGFAQVLRRNHINLRVYERGTGETLACGTGACAATAVGCVNGLLDETVQVDQEGGSLRIQWPFSVSEESPVIMTGPACIIYDGIIEDS
ncbi:MAG: diaminopimelate epimerase [Gammaproteobacteria bacterium]|nr:diaminopimelate epimerase [Gammaproteobacteria bacterium]HBW83004.1 diaminopimelate epimerase [Gammaproteobacteria bacterium]|tara:strand:- start:4258 stop:5112 length:855 start_codon:yes stop_codon:yes gene_type:complete